MALTPLDCLGSTDKDITFNTTKEANIQHISAKWHHHNVIQSVTESITKLKVRIPEQGRHGISSLELCLLFAYRTEATILDDLGQAVAQNKRILQKPAPFSRIVQNFAVATRRIIDATPGGRSHKPIWAARAPTGHMLTPLGSLSSVASLGFTVDINRQEEDHIILTPVKLHDHKTPKGINKLGSGNFWATRRFTNLRQGRPYNLAPPTPAAQTTPILYAIPIHDQARPIGKCQARRSRTNNARVRSRTP